VAAGAGDRLASAPRDQLVRLAAAAGGVTAGVADAQPWVQHGRDAIGAGAQAELHVLGEQVDRGIERPEPGERLGGGGQARGDRPADRAGGPRAVGLGPLEQRSRQEGRVDERGQQRADRAGQRVGGALDAAVGVQQPRGVECARVRPCDPRERGERAVDQLAVRVEQDRDVVPRTAQAGVAGCAEAGVVRQLDDVGPGGAGERCAVVAGAAVDHHELRPLGEVGVDRSEQRA
jgi:hypothetical protein